jgi:phosphoribosylaminoimidazole-succinocarboxamide synthase
MAAPVVTSIAIEGLKNVAHGKVRDLFEIDENTLLFVASDRISAYDVIMENVNRLHSSSQISDYCSNDL